MLLGVDTMEWKKIADLQIENDQNEILIDTDLNGNPFEIRNIFIQITIRGSTANSVAGDAKISLNNNKATYALRFEGSPLNTDASKVYSVILEMNTLDETYTALEYVRSSSGTIRPTTSGGVACKGLTTTLGGLYMNQILLSPYSEGEGHVFGAGTIIRAWGC
jgi:hypothetical protein